jgi:hypothetical protein
MSGLAHLRSLAQGRRPADDGLLGNVRCAWGGTEILSEEAVLAAFAAQPFSLDGALLEVETAEGAALIGPEGALYADLYDARVGRLWRIGGAPALPPEPAVNVAFDVDMRQERGELSFRAEDHPSLDPAAAEPLLSAAREMIEELRLQGKLRVRGFVVRACGSAPASAALVALYTLSNEISRTASFSFAVLGAGPGGEIAHKAIDPARSRDWTPRL